jgi:hypothetical protein
MKRIVTIQVEITDQKKAAWIWDNHMGKDTNNGVYVTVIRNGPIPEEEEDGNENS